MDLQRPLNIIAPLPTIPADQVSAAVAALRSQYHSLLRQVYGGTKASMRQRFGPAPASTEALLTAFFAPSEQAGTVTLRGLPDSGYASALAGVALAVLAPYCTSGAIAFLDESGDAGYAQVVDANGSACRELVPSPVGTRYLVSNTACVQGEVLGPFPTDAAREAAAEAHIASGRIDGLFLLDLDPVTLAPTLLPYPTEVFA